MGFMDKMKAAAGVGTASLQVDVKQRPGKRGEELHAVARVVGGKQAQKLNYVAFAVEYEGKWTITNADGQPIQIEGKAFVTYVRPDDTRGHTVAPGQALEFPFTCRIPSDSPLTSDTLAYKFACRADIEGTADPTFSTGLEIRG